MRVYLNTNLYFCFFSWSSGQISKNKIT